MRRLSQLHAVPEDPEDPEEQQPHLESVFGGAERIETGASTGSISARPALITKDSQSSMDTSPQTASTVYPDKKPGW